MSYRVLPRELQLKVQEELNEVPSRVNEDIEQIQKWIEKQPHLKAIRKDDQLILTFLRNAKFSLERAKAKLDAFYTVRSTLPDLFDDRDPLLPEIQEILKRGVIVIIRDGSNETVPILLMLRWERAHPDMISIVTIFKVVLMMMDVILLESDGVVINGGYLLEDFSGFSINYLSQITPTIIKQAVVVIQDAYPIRSKGLYFVNSPGVAETLFNIMKAFLKEKLAKRFHVLGASGSERVKRDIPPSILPNDYGGTAGDFDEIAAAWKIKLESYRDWFRDDGKYRTDESERLDRSPRGDLLFGEEGSFRKLEVD